MQAVRVVIQRHWERIECQLRKVLADGSRLVLGYLVRVDELLMGVVQSMDKAKRGLEHVQRHGLFRESALSVCQSYVQDQMRIFHIVQAKTVNHFR